MKNRNKLVICIIGLLFNCTNQEPSPKPYPIVETIEVVNVNSSGATFVGKVDYSSVEILDHGFIVSESQNPAVAIFYKIPLGKGDGVTSFNYRMGGALENGAKYFITAYAVSKNYTVYGETIDFISAGSAPPTIKSFRPSRATWGDTISISGKYLSAEIKFGDSTANIVTYSDTLIRVTVPNTLSPNNFITAQLGASISFSLDTFKLKPPVIIDFYPKSGSAYSGITISGKYWNTKYTKAYLNDTLMYIEYFANNSGILGAFAKIPLGLSPGNKQLKMTIGGESVIADSAFVYK